MFSYSHRARVLGSSMRQECCYSIFGLRSVPDDELAPDDSDTRCMEIARQLRFDILEQISQSTSTPLVLHGGTGITPEDFRRAILFGVRKINIATACFQASAMAARAAQEKNIFDVSQRMIDATADAVLEHLNIFGLAAKETK